MRQLLYVSTAVIANGPADLAGILESSRHNNALDGVTGLLWSDGKRFMQVIEGSDDAIEATFARIRADARHTGIDVVFDRPVAEREFGDWSMACRGPTSVSDEHDLRMLKRLGQGPVTVMDRFADLVAH